MLPTAKQMSMYCFKFQDLFHNNLCVRNISTAQQIESYVNEVKNKMKLFLITTVLTL